MRTAWDSNNDRSLSRSTRNLSKEHRMPYQIDPEHRRRRRRFARRPKPSPATLGSTSAQGRRRCRASSAVDGALGAWPHRHSVPSSRRSSAGLFRAGDIGILNYALTLEYLEAAFYASATRHRPLARRADGGATSRSVTADENAHVAYLKKALGSKARKSRSSTSRAPRPTPRCSRPHQVLGEHGRPRLLRPGAEHQGGRGRRTRPSPSSPSRRGTLA